MKITFCQFLIAITISGIAYAGPLKAQGVLDQTVSISVSNTSLLDVMSYLQKNNNVKFIYSKNAVNLSKKVSVNVANQPLKNVLNAVFATNGIGYDLVEDRVVLSNLPSSANNGAEKASVQAGIPITGKVVDQTGVPVIGATVVEKGTTNGAATDVNGNFKLNVKSTSSVLVVNFIGYNAQQVPVGDKTVFNITLTQDVKGLNEVVVVGYGTQSRRTVTGAIGSVKASDLQDQQITRIDDALQGRVSGVTVVQSSGAPGSEPTVRVRGTTSRINSNPLYVIDGVVVDNGGLDNINPNDIESIDVLKDASAAIYGSRSSNGVILVTTKKGKDGTPRITYNGYVGVQGPVSKVKLANSSQYETLRNESVTNDGGTAPFANPAGAGVGTNWQNQIFSNSAIIQNHNLSISGGSDKYNSYTSFGYLDQQGIVEPKISNYKRFNFTTNNSYKVKKWLTIGETFTYTYTRNQNNLNTNSVFGGPLSSALNLDPLTPTVVGNVAAQPNASIYNNEPYAIKNANGQYYGISNYVGQEITNPLAYVQTQLGNYGYSTNLLGSAFAEVMPIAGLKIRSQISAKQAYYGSVYFTPLYYLNGSSNNLSNTTQGEENDRNLTWNIDNTATYTRSFGQHNFSVLIGQSAEEGSGMVLGGTFIGEPVNSFSQASTNFALASANRIAYGGDNQPHTLASYFGRITYDYNQKYLFSGIIRRDGSSRFGSNNIYGTFPSAELGYVVTKEDWFPKNTFVDFLKLRGSYGVVGNEMALADFAYTSTVSGGRNSVFGYDNLLIGYSPNAPANPNLKWETTYTSDIALDATLLHNLTITVDFYKKDTKGMLQYLQLPAYSGFSGQPFYNVGNMQNKGVELELGYKNHVGGFNYNVNGNIAYNHNEVTYVGDQINYFTIGSVQSANYEIGRFQVGQPVGAFYGFQELGTFKSQADIDNYKNSSGGLFQPNAKPGDFKWTDVNGDGKIDANDRKFLGNPLPTFTYGINFNANYNNLDLKVFGQGVWGNKIYQAYRRLDIPTANYPIAALNAWTPTNASSNYPRLSDSDPNNNFKNPSNFYLQSGAYFRIKTLQIGYSLPAGWLKAADVQKVRVFLSSNNLATITGYKGYDPEISGGIDYGIYPKARTYMIGLDVTL